MWQPLWCKFKPFCGWVICVSQKSEVNRFRSCFILPLNELLLPLKENIYGAHHYLLKALSHGLSHGAIADIKYMLLLMGKHVIILRNHIDYSEPTNLILFGWGLRKKYASTVFIYFVFYFFSVVICFCFFVLTCMSGCPTYWKTRPCSCCMGEKIGYSLW